MEHEPQRGELRRGPAKIGSRDRHAGDRHADRLVLSAATSLDVAHAPAAPPTARSTPHLVLEIMRGSGADVIAAQLGVTTAMIWKHRQEIKQVLSTIR